MSDLLSIEEWSKLPDSEQVRMLQLLQAEITHIDGRLIDSYYPDTGPLRRELYPKHLEFFDAGRIYRERCFLAANRVGKTEGGGGYETSLHLTGQYPDWWTGRRFDGPVKFWAAGKTNETTRDIVQTKLFGEVLGSAHTKRFSGKGLVPRDSIIKDGISWKQGVSDLADKIDVQHVSGGISTCGIKCYQQGRGAFEGTEQDGIWLDEEPPMSIYGECLIRTATTNGIVYITFTPLEGMSQVVMSFLPKEFQLAGD